MINTPGTEIKIDYFEFDTTTKSKSYEVIHNMTNADFKAIATAMRAFFSYGVKNIYRIDETNIEQLE